MAARMLASLRATISPMAARSSVPAVAGRQLLEPQLAHAQGAPLGAEVAENLVGRARVRRDDRDDALLLAVFLPDLGRRNAKPFLEVVENSFDALAARPRPAHVGVVEDVHGEAHERALVERRLGDEEVGKMPRAEERIVEQDGVARAAASRADAPRAHS